MIATGKANQTAVADKVEDVYSLSPMQSGLLFHTLYSSEAGVYLDQVVCAIDGDLDTLVFEKAWQHVAERHSVLRTSFHWEGLEEPLQVVHSAAPIPIDYLDWRGLSEIEQQTKQQELFAADRLRGIDLTQAPVMRLTMIRTAADAWLMLLSIHHLVMDRWSLSQLLSEIRTAYDAIYQERRVQLPRVRPYRDYIRWLREQDPVRAEAHWRSTLAGFTAPTALSVDRAPGRVAGGGLPAFQRAELSEETVLMLQSLARKHHLTLSTFIQGAWALLLSHYSGEEDVVFGGTVAGRPASLDGVETMVGLFLNALPIRVRTPRGKFVLSWLQELQHELTAMRDYEYSSLVQIQSWSDVPRGAPLFDSTVTVQNISISSGSANGSISGAGGSSCALKIRLAGGEVWRGGALSLTATPGQGALRLTISYDVDRYHEDDVTRMVGHLCALMDEMAADLNRPLGSLPMLTDAQRRQLIVDWNDTAAEYARDRCVQELFEEQAARTPDAVAVAFRQETLTYSQLNARANQLAHHLILFGVGPEVLVGLCMDRSIEMVVGLLGILKAGAAYVPLDPGYPLERLAFMLEDSQASVLLSREACMDALPSSSVHVICLDTDWRQIEGESEDNPQSGVTADNIAYVIYTSGTTGKPKGAMVRHGGLTNYLSWAASAYDVASGKGSPLHSSLSFDLTVTSLFPALLTGGRVELLAEAEGVEALGHALSEHPDFSLVKITPAHLELLSLTLPYEKANGATRSFIIGGEALFGEQLSFWREHAPDTRLINEYGPTETVVGCCVYECDPNCELGSGGIPIGRPISNTRLYVLDGSLHPVPVGVPGELYIGGDGLGRGYLNRADLTAERFVPDPFSVEAGARLYRTGDLVRYRSDANLEYLGRLDHQVKIRGFRIELGEIESALLGHAGIREAVVLAREDVPGDRRLAAYVVCDGASIPEPRSLQEYLKQTLPEYMVPSAFVFLEALPLTPNGKVDRKALPAPDAGAVQADAYVAPRTPIEEGLAEIWSAVLHVERVGIHDSFFDLGGHSLLATQVISRIRTTFRAELPLHTLFDAPTVAGLAGRITDAVSSGTSHAHIVVRADRAKPIPLSFSQQRLWFLDQFEPDTSLYTIPTVLRLKGVVNADAMQQGIEELVRRHESLRTTFDVVEAEPVQITREPALVRLEVVDLSSLGDEQRKHRANQLIQDEVQRPFDLRLGPLFRPMLVRLSDEEHIMLLTMHHIISDGWSQGVLRRELSALYNAFCNGLPSPLADLPIQYADYAYWQRNWLQNEVLDRQVQYWKQNLEGAPALLELPSDRPRPAVQRYRGAVIRFQLPVSLSQSIKRLGQSEGTTQFMNLLAAFQVLLSRYSRQNDIVVGTPIAGRTLSEVEGLIGFFVNTIPLRGNLSGDPRFTELLSNVRETALEAYAHQDLPFEKLVDELQPQRSLSHAPLFQVSFNFANAPRGGLGFEGVEVEGIGSDPISAKFDLSLVMSETGGTLTGAIQYNTDLFNADRIHRMVRNFEILLEGIVSNPSQRLSRLPLLSDAERNQVLVEWNATDRRRAADCLHNLIEAQVDRTPNAVAVSFEGTSLTYLELDNAGNKLAHHLKAIGLTPGSYVGILLDRSAQLVVSLLAILKAGCAYVPLDPDYPSDRLSFMLADSGISVLISESHLESRVDTYCGMTLLLDKDLSAIKNQPLERPGDVVSPSDTAYVIYTSGSTGKPKGVIVSHSAILNHMEWMASEFPLTPDDRVPLKTPISFDASVWECWAPLMAGAELVVARQGGQANPEYLVQLVRERAITTIKLVPSLLQMLLEDEEFAECESLRQVFCGAEVLPRDLHDQFYASFTERVALHNLYGPTEAAVDATGFSCRPDWDQSSVPIGRPISNVQAYILDDHLQPSPIGVLGELYLSGMSLATGYMNGPDLTAEKFVPNPFSRNAGQRMYRTGDLCRFLPDGNIVYIGRLDRQVKIRGFRIELGEIEHALQSHADVRAVAVMVREDVPGDRRLAAYVVGDADSIPEPRSLQEYLKQTLPEYMVPSAFVFLEALPLTPNGKVDRKALPAPDAGAVQADAYVAPRTPVEEGLAEIWGSILRVENVGVHDNFFGLGGHSLLATQVISRIRTTFQAELPLRALFEAPTIAGLAERIAAAGEQNTQVPPMARASRELPLPLSFAQQRLWFLDQFEPGSALYNIPMVLRLAGALNTEALQQSLSELLHRHESLRTTFSLLDGEPVQIIRPPSECSLEFVDLRSLDSASREKEAQRLVQEGVQRPFDLQQGPLFRAGLVCVGDEEHILLLTLHHIVSDGWSQGVLRKELSTLYNAFSQGKLNTLPQLPIQYADYAAWQRSWLQGEALEQQIGYWKQNLQGAPALLELPTDRPRPPAQTFNGALKRLQLPEPLSQSLKQLGQREGATLFMTLLAAFQVLLYRYSGQDDIVVGTPIANRTQSETEGVIGFFTNTLALRGDLSGDPSFLELLARVRTTALGAYTHQDLPFEKLVEELQPERSMSHSPLFQVVFMHLFAAVGGAEFNGLQLAGAGSQTVTAKYDLTLGTLERAGALHAVIEYNADLFDENRIKGLLDHYQSLLEHIVANPATKISSVPLLTDLERHQLLVEWNSTECEYPRERCMHELVEEQALRTPEAVAVTFEDEQLTYGALNGRANQLAHTLRKHGVGPEVLVGVFAERSIEMVVGLLAILKAGGAYVPLDPSYPPERLAFMLEDTQTTVLLTQSRLQQRLTGQSAQIICLESDAFASEQSEQGPSGSVTSDNLAYVIYTSGSTGRPKGVEICHRNLLNLVNWHICAYTSEKALRSTQVARPAFDASVWEIWPCLAVGATLCIVNEETMLSAPALVEWLRDNAAEVCFLPTPMAEIVLEEASCKDLPLRTMLTGGDRLHHVPRQALPFTLVNHYGPTECTVVSTAGVVHPDKETVSPSIGRPISNTRIYILNCGLEPTPVGVAGEIYIGGASVARGYLNRPELTAERFIPDPFGNKPGERLYKTGDQARYLADGSIDFLGRADDQVKIRGFRIELGEIESVLLTHPQVYEAVVIAREDRPGEKRLAAYIGRAEGAPSASLLREYLLDKLPAYMAPSAFVFMESLPLTPNGKVDRKALPAPEMSGQQEDTYAAPRTPIEQGLAEIWCEVLHLARVSIHDSFFDLGGHSLMATQVMSRVRNTFQIELPLRVLFEEPTVSGLAEQVVALQRSGAGVQIPPITAASREGLVPTSFAQQRLWFIDRLNPESTAYNVTTSWHVRCIMDVDAMQRALDALVARHEVLRTTFTEQDGNAMQVISAEMTFPLRVVSISGLPESEREAEIRRLSAQAADAAFDLTSGPLIRGMLIRVDEQDHVMMVTSHHIVTDGWSMAVFMKELSTLYSAYQMRNPCNLPALPIQYADYAIWQREMLSGPPLDRLAKYWESKLAHAPPLLELPTDHPRSAALSLEGNYETLFIPAQVNNALQELSRSERATPFMTLLAIFNVLLYAYTNQLDIIVGTDDAGRNQADLEHLIGFFINHLVLRTNMSGNPTFRELVQRVRTMTLEAYAHQDMPFDKLVELLRPDRDVAYSPLFQVLFVMQAAPSSISSDSIFSSSGIKAAPKSSKYDIVLFVRDSPSGLATSWLYRTDLFEAATIHGMVSDFEALVRFVAASPDATIADLKGLVLLQTNSRAKIATQERRQSSRSSLRTRVQRTE